MHEIVNAVAKINLIGLVSVVRQRHVNNSHGRRDFLEIQQAGAVTREFRNELAGLLEKRGFKIEVPDQMEGPNQMHLHKVEKRRLLPDAHHFYTLKLKTGVGTTITVHPFKARKLRESNQRGKLQVNYVPGEPKPISRWEEYQLSKRIKQRISG